MLLLALALLAVQDPGVSVAGPHAPYQPPEVRPFEPPSAFGREVAEGDGGAERGRRPLTAAVPVDRYSRTYEPAPTNGEVAYRRGVESAEAERDRLSGPLDGSWTVRAADGAALLRLTLSDSADGFVEGAWAEGRRVSPIRSADAGEPAARLDLDDHTALELERSTDGWRGRLIRDGRSQAVTMIR
jgi:hypothetical protein